MDGHTGIKNELILKAESKSQAFQFALSRLDTGTAGRAFVIHAWPRIPRHDWATFLRWAGFEASKFGCPFNERCSWRKVAMSIQGCYQDYELVSLVQNGFTGLVRHIDRLF